MTYSRKFLILLGLLSCISLSAASQEHATDEIRTTESQILSLLSNDSIHVGYDAFKEAVEEEELKADCELNETVYLAEVFSFHDVLFLVDAENQRVTACFLEISSERTQPEHRTLEELAEDLAAEMRTPAGWVFYLLPHNSIHADYDAFEKFVEDWALESDCGLHEAAYLTEIFKIRNVLFLVDAENQGITLCHLEIPSDE